MLSFCVNYIIRSLFAAPARSGAHAYTQQKSVLNHLRKTHKHCLFLQQLQTTQDKRTASLIRQLPLSEYHDLLPFIEQCRQWQDNILVSGQIKHFAKTSGSSSGWHALREKWIPVPLESMKRIDHAMMKIFFHHYLSLYPQSRVFLGKTLTINSGVSIDELWVVTGYISWVLSSQTPWLLEKLYRRPSMDIASISDRPSKKDAIIQQIRNTTITCIAGVTAWILDILSSYGERYGKIGWQQTFGMCQLIFIGGGPAWDYKEKINALFDQYQCPRPHIANSYNASEWSYAIQMDHLDDPRYHDMRLITHNDIYYEFITKADRLHASTISDKAERDVYHKDHTITLKQVQKYVDYIIIQSSSRGLWRYVIGDVISFVDNDQTTAPTIRHQGRIGWHSNMFNEHMEAGHVIAAVDAAKVINPTLHSASFISWPRELSKAECLTYDHVWPLYQYVFIIEADEADNSDTKQIEAIIHRTLQQANSNYERLSNHHAKIVTPWVTVVPHGHIRHYVAQHKKILSPQWSMPLLREDNREWIIKEMIS